MLLCGECVITWLNMKFPNDLGILMTLTGHCDTDFTSVKFDSLQFRKMTQGQQCETIIIISQRALHHIPNDLGILMTLTWHYNTDFTSQSSVKIDSLQFRKMTQGQQCETYYNHLTRSPTSYSKWATKILNSYDWYWLDFCQISQWQYTFYSRSVRPFSQRATNSHHDILHGIYI